MSVAYAALQSAGFRRTVGETHSFATDMRSISKLIACFCLLLAFSSSIAFAAHYHSNDADAAKCTVCVAAHSASPNTSSPSPKVTFVSLSTFRPQPVSAKQSVVVFALSVRPPPSV